MKLTGTISKAIIHRMDDLVNSDINIWVDIAETKETIWIEDKDSIPNLSKKYGFLYTKDSCNLRNMYGRKCIVVRTLVNHHITDIIDIDDFIQHHPQPIN